ncbi:hypothetical protein BDV59DRAFT_203853 [Aspergillus ambiguus]|uniref:uncharacterized protein n=1 Tax=Aspergillus ambiguus TaxID=176160 RepID=UPI003CCD1A26
MENPESEISGVILRLTQGSPQVQSNTIDQYFTSNAVFVHPFCRTWDIDNGRWYVKKIYQWYKVMSPEIQLTVNSIAFDKDHLKLYVNISQVFSIWAVPFHSSDVTLTTVLSLTERVDGAMPGANGNQSGKTRYYIARQEDLYQTSDPKSILVHVFYK